MSSDLNQSEEEFGPAVAPSPVKVSVGGQSSPARQSKGSGISVMPTIISATTVLIFITVAVVAVIAGRLFAWTLPPTLILAAYYVWKFINRALTDSWTNYEMGLLRRVAPDRRHELTEDSRPPILYLRSFADDEVAGQSSYRSKYYFRLNTEEAELVSILEEQGPTIKIAKPGGVRHTWGAVSVNAEEADWQRTVTDLMLRAQLVVMRAGMSGGLLWELREAVRLISPTKLLIMIPYDGQEYEHFRRVAEQHLPRPLPEYYSGSETMGSLRGAIYFRPDWNAGFLTIDDYVGSALEVNKISTAMRLALRPVYEQLGWGWTPRPVRVSLFGLAILILLATTVGLCLIISFAHDVLRALT